MAPTRWLLPDPSKRNPRTDKQTIERVPQLAASSAKANLTLKGSN
jgi:hypothetical protein